MEDIRKINFKKEAYTTEIPYGKIQFIVLSAVLASLIHASALYLHESTWILVTSKLFYLPILYAAITSGLVVGTITGILASLLHMFIMIYILPHNDLISHLFETISIMIVAVFTGILSDHQRYEKKIRKKMEQYSNKLNELVKTRDKFFSIIAHDLRGPVSSQYNFLENLNLKSNQLTLEEINKYLTLLKDSSKNISNLLENLLTWSRSQIGEIEFRPANHHLFFLAQSTVNLFQEQALLKKITLINSVPTSINAYFDFQMIQTILRNLIGNAIKFTMEGGMINISAESIGDKVIVSIKDNGIGMDDKVKEKLFRLGARQNHGIGTKGEKGTGLGLLIIKEFIDLHGETISVESKKGIGTEFRFSLKMNRE